jgi:hypothetical protein
MAWRLEVNGVNKTAYLHQPSRVAINQAANERSTAQFTTIAGYIPARGDAVTIYDTDGTTALFAGVVLKRRLTGVGGLNWCACQCAGWELYLDQVSVTLSYTTTKTLKQVLTDLVAALSSYSITLDGAQVDGPTLDAFTWAPLRASDALRDLARVTGYVWVLSADKALRMVRPGGNEFVNGRFLDGLLTTETAGDGADWVQGSGDDGVTWQLGCNFTASTSHYYPREQGWGAAWARYIGTPPANTYRAMGGQKLPVSVGTSYTFAGFLACHQMRDIALGITWRTAANADISTDYSAVVVTTETSGYNALENLSKFGFTSVTATAPSTAAYAYVFIRGRHPVATGGTNPYMFWTGLWFGAAADRVSWAVTDGAATPYCTSLTWNDPSAPPATIVTLRCGPSGTFQTTRSWVADGVQDDFVGYVPAGGLTVGYVTVGGVMQTVGAGAQWTWNQATTTLSRGTAARPTAGTVVTLIYAGVGPFDVSADSGATPPVLWVEERPLTLDYASALHSAAAAILSQVGQTTQDVRLSGLQAGMAVNRTLRVASSLRALIAEVILTRVSLAIVVDATATPRWEWSGEGTTGTLVGESPLAEYRAA